MYLNALNEVIFQFGTFTPISSYVFAAIFFVLMSSNIIIVPVLKIWYRKDPSKLDKSVFSELFNGIKKDRILASQYHLVYTL